MPALSKTIHIISIYLKVLRAKPLTDIARLPTLYGTTFSLTVGISIDRQVSIISVMRTDKQCVILISVKIKLLTAIARLPTLYCTMFFFVVGMSIDRRTLVFLEASNSLCV